MMSSKVQHMRYPAVWRLEEVILTTGMWDCAALGFALAEHGRLPYW